MPYQPIGGIHEEIPADEPLAAEATTVTASAGKATGAAAKKAPIKKTNVNPAEERGSALQKIAKLDIKGRIQLAMKGSKEERSLLIRDGTKIVALAVLESPKVSDGEVERFATQKNVLEAVLRGIPMKRRFAKNYAIVRNLVFNPRTPLDLSLGLMKNMLVGDLRNLSRQQRNFRHGPQAGHQNVQAEDGQSTSADRSRGTAPGCPSRKLRTLRSKISGCQSKSELNAMRQDSAKVAKKVPPVVL